MKRPTVKLSLEEIDYLRSFKKSGKRSQREYDRANILLLLHKDKKDIEIEDFLEVERTTIWRTRKRFLKEGLVSALEEKPRSGQPKKYGQNQEAELIALACRDAPEGRARWTLELLTEILGKKGCFANNTRESTADTKKNECKPWLRKMWCVTSITKEYRKRMYGLLDLYAKGYDEQFPVVCMDEKSKQLLIDLRGTIAMKPGSPAKYDYEYKRNGTRNIFVAVEPLAGKRTIKVTGTRKKIDFAQFIKGLVENDYQKAKKVRLVLDNLNTHFPSSFYEAFSKEEANRILGRIEFYYTPKHGSWLNMAEIEINMMDRECLARRIGEAENLKMKLIAGQVKGMRQRKKSSGHLQDKMQIVNCLNTVSYTHLRAHETKANLVCRLLLEKKKKKTKTTKNTIK